MKGDLWLMPFPFSDLSGVKRRPVVVLALTGGRDVIVCQMTTQRARSAGSIPIEPADLASGTLATPGLARPDKLFSADRKVLYKRLGTLDDAKLDEIVGAVVGVLRS